MESNTIKQSNSQEANFIYDQQNSVILPNDKHMDHNDVRISDETFAALKEWTSEFVGQKEI